MDPNKIDTIEVKFRITLAFILILFSLAFTSIYHFLPSYRDTLIFLTAIIGGSAALYTAFYTAQSLIIGLQRDKIKSAFELTRQLDSIELIKVRTLVIDELSNRDIEEGRVWEIITSDKDKHDAVRSVLNHLEDISIAIQRGLVDEEVIYLALGYLAPHIYKTLKPYIEDQRDKRRFSKLASELELLVKSWENKKFLSNDAKINEDIFLNYVSPKEGYQLSSTSN